jgi:hypothetical protein
MKARFDKLERLLRLNIETTPSGTKILWLREHKTKVPEPLLISERLTYICLVVVTIYTLMQCLQSMVCLKGADRIIGALEEGAVVTAKALENAGVISDEGRLEAEEGATDNEKKWRRRKKRQSRRSTPGNEDLEGGSGGGRSSGWDHALREKDSAPGSSPGGVRRRGSDTPLTAA